MADLTISIDINAAAVSDAIEQMKKGLDGLKTAFSGMAKEGAKEAEKAVEQTSKSFSSLAKDGLQQTIANLRHVNQVFKSLASEGVAELEKNIHAVDGSIASFVTGGLSLVKKQAGEAQQSFQTFGRIGVELVRMQAAGAKVALEALAQGGIGPLKAQAEQAKQALIGFVNLGIETAKTGAGNAKQAFLDFAQGGIGQIKGKLTEARQSFLDFAANGAGRVKLALGDVRTSLTDLASGALARAKSALESLTKIDLGAMSQKIEGFGKKLESVANFFKNNVTSPLTGFWGKDDASKEIEGKIAQFKERVNDLLSKLFAPVMPYLSKGADALIGIVDRLIAWFDNAPESVRVFIAVLASIAVAIGPVIGFVASAIIGIAGFVSAISAIAAAGTVSVVIGMVAAAIAALVAGIGIAIGVVYALHQAWAAGFGPIASIVAIAVGLIITAFSPILGLPILIGAVAVTIYEMWAANFGGLQDFTTQVWAKIQEYIAIAMAEINALVAMIGADVIAWWTENYPLIEQTVQKVSDAVKAYIQNFLAAITSFWDAHGEQIMSVVRSIWNIISTIVRTGINVVMQVVRMVMQMINGDWAGAWNTAKDIVSKIISAIGTILKELGNIVWQALKFVVTMIVNLGTDLFSKAVEIGKNIVQGIINGVGSLAASLWQKGRDLISGLLGGMRSEGGIKSPSAETFKDGVNFVQGEINGLNSMSPELNATGRRLVDGLLTEMREGHKKAAEEFYTWWNLSKEGQRIIAETQNYQDRRSGLENLVKLRAELNMNVGDALPFTLKGINDELETLGKQKKGLQDAKQMLEQMQEQLKFDPQLAKTNAGKVETLLGDDKRNARIDVETRAELRRNAAVLDARARVEQFDQAKKKLVETGFANNMQIQGEINLLQAQIAGNFKLSEVEAQRIKNQIEVEKYKADLKNDGYNDDEIARLAAVLEAQQKHTEGLRATLRAKQDLIAAEQTYTGAADQMRKTLEDLNVQLGLKKAASEADRLATDMQTEAYKKLNAEQAASLKSMAEEIDRKRAEVEAKEKAKKQMDEFKGFIKDSLNTLAKDGFGAFFKGILDKFKQMLIDMAAEWIASKIYNLIFKNGGKSIADAFNSIFKGLKIGGADKGVTGAAATVAHEAAHAAAGGGSNAIGDAMNAASGVRGLFDPLPNLANGGKPSALAGKLSGIGAIATMVGGFLPGRLGNVVSMAGMGLSIGANFGPWGAAIGAAAGAIIGLFMGDPKKKIDKKENMPKLQKGFTESLQQLRDLLSDRNQIFSDPDGAIQRATEIRGQIASGFGIEFQSKKYKAEAKKLIAAKLIEADALIKQIKDMADVARMAKSVDTRLEAEFAGGVYADRSFIRAHSEFRRRNGLLSGAFTGRDTLPSILAPGEMVLNPKQIAHVKFNAGFDAFKGAGIPNYATGGMIGSPAPASTPVSVSPQPVTVQIVLNNSGIVESVLVNGLKSSDVQVELVKAYDKGKTRTR